MHTTRRRSPGVLTKDETQIVSVWRPQVTSVYMLCSSHLFDTLQVLLDTPGIVHYRYGHKLKMSKELLTDAGRALMEADLGSVTPENVRELSSSVIFIFHSRYPAC